MAAFDHKELCGSLFKNDLKKTDKQPDMTGVIKVNGTLMQIAAWRKEGSRGHFLSIKISEKRAQQGQDENRSQEPPQRQQPRQQPAQRPAYQPARPSAAQRTLNQPYPGEPELPESAGTSLPEEEIPFAPNWI